MAERSVERQRTLSGEDIRAIRELLGLSEAQFADALWLGNRNTIIREYQSGKREPAPPTIRAIKLLEAVVDAHRFLRQGRTQAARETLLNAMGETLQAHYCGERLTAMGAQEREA